jgi:galactokinase
VPIGGGVSSSAALEIGSGLAMLSLAGQRMEPVQLALLGRQAEHKYASSPCGIMDQFICTLGKADHALMLDCRSQAFDHVPFSIGDAVLMVMNTQVKHEIGSSEYPVRQKQCADALEALKSVVPDATALRDISSDILAAHGADMDDLAFRRARHVVTENERTLQATDALRAGDLQAFGKLMFASHDSLRDDYEVSCQELDDLVDIASRVDGVYGARMTGGGFGGCAIALVKSSAENSLREAINQKYNTAYDKPAIVYTTSASDGAFASTL